MKGVLQICFQDEVVREVSTAKGNVAVRNLTLKDKSGTIPVTLWRENATSPVKAGDIVKITHMSPKKDGYLKKLVVHSTHNTTIEVSEWKKVRVSKRNVMKATVASGSNQNIQKESNSCW